jgi:hypothetical protein
MPNTHRIRLLSLGLVATALLAAPAPEGLPPGDSEGWIDLLADAGPGLKGWTRVPIPPSGKLNPESQWSLDPKSGTLTCGGDKGHEWLRWDHELGDFVYRVEWRFVPVEGKARYNSGIYARNSADGAIWHQAQTGDASGGYLFGETPVSGVKARVNFAKQVRGKPVKPAGSWNAFEITCRGKTMTLRVNGEVTNTWDGCEVPRGYVGLEAEGYKIEFRDVRLKPL